EWPAKRVDNSPKSEETYLAGDFEHVSQVDSSSGEWLRSNGSCDSPSIPRHRLTVEQERGRALAVTDQNRIAAPDLAAGHQVRQWLDEQALDGALQVTRAILGIGTLPQQ